MLKTLLETPEGDKKANDIITAILIQENLTEKQIEALLTIFSDPSVRSLLTTTGWELPTSLSKLQMQNIIRGSQYTRILFESAKKLPDRDADVLLKIIGDGFNESPINLPSRMHFSEYRSAAYEAYKIRNIYDMYSSESTALRKPIVEAATESPSLNFLSESDWTHVHAFWGRLGLKEAFTRQYPTPNSFWNSKQSLVEIYNELITQIQPEK